MSAKQTAFTPIHERLGGKIVEFAGYAMPVQYSGIVGEHRRVRESVGIFDVSHMGEVEIRGKDALDFLQKITVNDVSRLSEGRVQYSAMCYRDGGIVDDLLVYHLGDRYMLVINASNTAKDIAWMRENLTGDVVLTDQSDATSLLAVQGPHALDTLQRLTRVNLGSLPYYHATHGRLADVEMLISRTGYTGERGYELYFPSDPALGAKVWQAIMDAGKGAGILPIGLGARDTLRLEMGFCLYGNDIDQTTHPLEAGLGWITRLDKPDFNGKEVLVKANQGGLKRKLVGFTMDDKAFPRHGYAIHAAGAPAGTVTSGTFSPILERGIAMGYVSIAHAKPGTRLEIIIRDRAVPARVTPLPFVKNSAT
jgi:glycine cleavage system T protein (aminomethyltransferase)